MKKSPKGGRGPKGAIIGGSPQSGSPPGSGSHSPYEAHPPPRSPMGYGPPVEYNPNRYPPPEYPSQLSEYNPNQYPPPEYPSQLSEYPAQLSEVPLTNVYPPPEHLTEQKGRSKPRIKTTRRCRDIPFLVIFLLFVLGMIINSSWGWNKGNPRRLLFGVDYTGHVCSGDYDVTYWMNPNEVYDSGVIDNPFKIVNARSICLKGCPSPSGGNASLAWVCDYPEGPIKLTKKQWADQNYNYYDSLTSDQKNSSLNLQGPCYPVLFQSDNLLWSCQLHASANNVSLQEWQNLGGVSINEGDFIISGIHDLINKPTAILKRYIADLGHAWPVLVVCGGIAPLLLSLVWLLLVRLFVGIVIWITIAVLNLATIAVTVWLYIKAGWIGTDQISMVVGSDVTDALLLDSSDSMQKHLKIVAVIMTVICVILLLITIVLIRRIYLAVAVVKVSANSIAAIPSLIIYPIFPTLILGIFYVLWISALLYLVSAGEVRQNTCNDGACAYNLATQTVECSCGFKFHHSKHAALAILYHIFGGFWIAQFINACSLTIVAGAVVSYYWVRGELSQLPTFPVLSSTRRLVRYSLGSMAVGSFLVALIEMIRFILEVIRKKLKALQALPGGCCISLFCCCAQCCLGCIEWTIKFINRNAYIVIAIKGKGFFGAAAKASALIVNNILRVGTVNIIADFVLFLGKVSVATLGTFFAFLMLEQHHYKSGSNKVSSPLFPTLFTWIIAYSVANLFFGVVEMAIDSILLSFCIDSEENNGVPRYAPPLLLDTLARHTRHEEEREAKKGLQ